MATFTFERLPRSRRSGRSACTSRRRTRSIRRRFRRRPSPAWFWCRGPHWRSRRHPAARTATRMCRCACRPSRLRQKPKRHRCLSRKPRQRPRHPQQSKPPAAEASPFPTRLPCRQHKRGRNRQPSDRPGQMWSRFPRSLTPRQADISKRRVGRHRGPTPPRPRRERSMHRPRLSRRRTAIPRQRRRNPRPHRRPPRAQAYRQPRPPAFRNR